jgi:hypothetical protein
MNFSKMVYREFATSLIERDRALKSLFSPARMNEHCITMAVAVTGDSHHQAGMPGMFVQIFCDSKRGPCLIEQAVVKPIVHLNWVLVKLFELLPKLTN